MKDLQVGDKVRCIGESYLSFGKEGTVCTIYNNGSFVVDYVEQEVLHWRVNEGIAWKRVVKEKSYQTDVPYAFDAVPANALLKVASIFKTGAEKYGRDSWKEHVTLLDNINHSVGHQYMYLSGDTSEEHLANAACRALMALELYLGGKR